MIRKNLRKTACALTLLLCVPAAALACEGDDCPSAAKPLDIKQFMREQAASTRVSARRHPSAKPTAAKPKQAAPRVAAAKPAPATEPLPSNAAASFASHSLASQQTQDELPVRVFSGEEFNAIDNAAPTPETTGASFANDPNVQVVAAAEFNDIDRKAEETSSFPTIEIPAAATPAKPTAASAPAPGSWLQWLWSAVTGTFTALAAAVRQLIHV
jgi:hypothetical protein